MSERDFQQQVVRLATSLGWVVLFHPWTAVHSPAGWPDLVLCRPPRLLLVELKTDRGRLSPAQRRTLGLLGQCPGVEVAVWRPRDEAAILEALR